MAKIPFDIKFRPEIEAGKYEVVTRLDTPVKILCYDARGKYPIAGLVRGEETDSPQSWCIDGSFDGRNESLNDLFLVSAEQELTEFEEAVRACAFGKLTNKEEGETKEEYVKRWAAELLALARKELQSEIDAEVEKAYKNADRMQYEKGKEDALKDSPTWKKCEDGNTDRLELEALCREAGSPIEIAFRANGYRIFLSDLEKLPKEE